MVDIQPAWLYLDARTLAAQFGDDRLALLPAAAQPLRGRRASPAAGPTTCRRSARSGRSTPTTRSWGCGSPSPGRAKGYDGPLHPEEALTREQAIRFYTINNARLLFLEDRIGSLEAGKQADFVVIDRDLLTCPEDEIRETRALATYLDGKRVFERRGLTPTGRLIRPARGSARPSRSGRSDARPGPRR